MICVREQLRDGVGRERVVVTADSSAAIHQNEPGGVDRAAIFLGSRRTSRA